MRTRLSILCLALMLGPAAYLVGAAGARPAAMDRTVASSAAIRQFHGTVANSNRVGRWIDVQLNTSTQVVRFHTARTTHWMSCDWSDMERGHLVAIGALRTNGLWQAVTIRALHHPEAQQ